MKNFPGFPAGTPGLLTFTAFVESLISLQVLKRLLSLLVA